MNKKTNWGILGCGNIAHSFAMGLKHIPNAQIIAVASKSGKAEKFGKQYGATYTYTNYEDLVANPEVDVIYVATTHNFHFENTKLCLENRKPVLCEKAFTINAAQLKILIDLARKEQLFLMEAMWSRFFPCMVKLREMIAQNKIGDVRLIKGDFGFTMLHGPEHRVFNPKLAGGALLDLGIYPISFASMILGTPQKITSSATMGETGVDIFSSYFLEYENGAVSMLSSSTQLCPPHTALVVGTKGYLEIPNFSRPKKMNYWNGKKLEHLEFPHKSPGYQFEALEVMNCLKNGKLESNIMSLDESLTIMETMDTMRDQWHFKYPEEK
ncbi:MAG: Gfo/Idh/MocA family protein [Promethearchaeota archaeon]